MIKIYKIKYSKIYPIIDCKYCKYCIYLTDKKNCNFYCNYCNYNYNLKNKIIKNKIHK